VDADEVADELHALPPKVTARSPGTNSPVTLPCVRHGRTTYDYGGCRCDVCTEASNEHHRKLRARRAAKRPEDNPLLWHGKVSTYKNHGYRCDACARAGAEANKRRPSRNVSPDRRLTP
jgi:hypothetical protein